MVIAQCVSMSVWLVIRLSLRSKVLVKTPHLNNRSLYTAIVNIVNDICRKFASSMHKFTLTSEAWFCESKVGMQGIM